MADISEDAIQLMGEMTLTCLARGDEKIADAGPDRVALNGETQKFIHVAMETVAQANQVRTLSQRGGTLLSQHVGALSSLNKRSTEVMEAGQAIRTATTKYIYARLLMESRDHDVHKLLSHFEPKIRAIIGDTLGVIGDNPNVLSTILEECYEQASGQGGELHIDGYFAPLYEAAFAWPYDPGFKAEQYYDHENRLQVDEDYAVAEDMRQQRSERDLPESPRYLFRTFDSASSGKSDEDMVASSASIYMPGTSRDDLLSLEPKEACKKLCAHLNKTCFGDADHADNLISWSSSLLFVLQYAIWRCNKHPCSPAEVSICVVDTTKFPYGQFARDMWLLKKYNNTTKENADLQNLLHLRVDYDNGEYLSQGTLTHQNRSCVVTLEKLIRSGLHDLHPEPAHTNGREGWTNRVRDLRSMWAEFRLTTQQEIRVASQIATKCFHALSTSEIAISLLTFKTRDHPNTSMKSKLPRLGLRPQG
ncbi:hypothetical protein LTR91_023648 [Friedmanniomyces endolithicus]|uniref:DUF7587 domain-containing protein n=1 Tax=Friedmanniomyces endolithicus TaxID=329885 RepID=A0AAN6H5V2_9PEZI|nr:hypothetical protein LTR57_023439 [Friedmanniomyces endolithicus]KAK0952605.1 hypothetical protein LTS01_024759 [Friedmanniomyces endolithicus]KAK0953804.1 hypothetical protein LTR91_023648 [Friedmanniomyces endolithicus]KAK1021837.1 hypothetical protein LTS16_026199 [Friedmanniomyces endolithicus]